MAAKVNTRFLLYLVLALAAAGGILGGVVVLKMRGDASRSYRKGLDAFNRQDYRVAYDQFGRALNKDPGNADYLQHVGQALGKIVPLNANEAGEFYQRYLAVLGHEALQHPAEAAPHLKMLVELHSAARRANDPRSWDTLLASAQSMSQRVADGDPLKPLAAVYRALAVGRLASTRSDDEITQAIAELDQAAATLSTNDLAWATQIALRQSWVTKMQASSKSRTSIDAQRDALDKAARLAIQRAPDGPETARAYLAYLLVRKFSEPAPGAPVAAATAADRPGEMATDEDLRAAAEHVVAVVTPAAGLDPGLINEAALALQAVPEIGRARAIDLLRRAVQANPLGYDHHLLLARLQLESDEPEQTEKAIRTLLDADPLPVCFMARMLFILRMQAAAMLGDVEYRRLERATAADKPTQMQKLVAARDGLAALSPDASNDPLVVRADGKIAFARGQFTEAAQKFEQLVRETDSRDPEMLAFAAASLQQIGQLGMAHERITRALATNPNYVPWIVAKAELELRTGQYEAAARTIEPIPATAALDAHAQQIVAAAHRGGGGGAGGGAPPVLNTDPVQLALLAAEDAMQKNEVDNARAALLAGLQNNPDAIELLQALAQVEFRAGNREMTAQYVERGLKINGDDQILKRMSANLRFEDPIEATLEYQRSAVSDNKARLALTLVSMASIAMQQRERAAMLDATGDAANAAKAREWTTRADAEAAKAATELAAIDAESPPLLDYQFAQALQAKDWARASELVNVGKRLNLDAAGGSLMLGRMELTRGNTREAIAALEAATDKLSFSAYAWRALAIAYQAAGNFAQAERAFEQAYRCNPNDINGARAYLGLLDRRGDKTRALQILQTVHRLAPQDLGLREAWLALEAAVGDSALALRERVTLYAKNPSDIDNAVAVAMLLSTTQPTRESMLNESGEPMFSPQRWASMSSIEQDQAKQDVRHAWANTADKIVADLAKITGDDLRVAVLRATIMRERGDLLGGETVLRDFIAAHEKASQTEDMYVELGRYQARLSHYTDAVASLQQAVALGGSKQREAQINLGQLHMQLRQHDEALKVLESALAKQDDQTTRLQIIECLINLGKLDDAEKRLAETATGTSGSVAILLSASIAKARGDALVVQGDSLGADKCFTQQRDLLARAEQQDPTNPVPRVLLAESLIGEYNRTRRSALLDDAMVALDRAERIRAGVPQVSTLRVAIQKERGDVRGAVAELQRQLEAGPDNLAARRDLIQLLLDSGDRAAAIEALDAAIRYNPTLASWHEMRGDALMLAAATDGQSGDVGQAVTSFAAAYDITPSTALLAKLAASMLLATPPDCRGAADRIASRQDDLPKAPSLRETYARALACLGERDKAIEQLRLAYASRSELVHDGVHKARDVAAWYLTLSAVYPGDKAADAERLVTELTGGKLTAYDATNLAGVWMRSGGGGAGGLSRALELQRQALELCPAGETQLRADLNSDLAGMLLMTGASREAAEAFEIVVGLRPDDWNALNNLAYLKAETLNDAAGALPLAERLAGLLAGRRGDPSYSTPKERENVANVLDTVGWVFFRNGDFERAKLHLSESAAILPLAPTYVHLAEAFLKSGDGAGAEKQLQEAEKLNPTSDTRQKIKSLRDDIGKSGAGGG